MPRLTRAGHISADGPADGSPAGGTLVHDLPPADHAALVADGFKGALGTPALATLMHRLSVLSRTHQVRELASPVRNPAVQELLRRVRRVYAARGVRPVPKSALTSS